MQFHEAPEFGYYAEPPELGYYGEAPELGYYAGPDLGYYAEGPELGYYGEPPYLGGYGEAPDLGYYGEPAELGYYGEAPDLGYYVAEAPEMVGYHAYEPLGEPDLSGYVREHRHPHYNPRCPLPINVHGFGEAPPLEGYARPRPVSPRVTNFVPPAPGGHCMPDTFRPLW